jgi:hypothetical protein
MLPWTMKIMAEERLYDLRVENGRRQDREGRYVYRHSGFYAAPEACGPRGGATRWQRLWERAGYRMISFGCRLARPAVVARVQAEL